MLCPVANPRVTHHIILKNSVTQRTNNTVSKYRTRDFWNHFDSSIYLLVGFASNPNVLLHDGCAVCDVVALLQSWNGNSSSEAHFFDNGAWKSHTYRSIAATDKAQALTTSRLQQSHNRPIDDQSFKYVRISLLERSFPASLYRFKVCRLVPHLSFTMEDQVHVHTHTDPRSSFGPSILWCSFLFHETTHYSRASASANSRPR
jgi:hypothetical protein